ncbi:hypothetical protein Pmani_022972 [Petrolisthes manimaculis]|uniref:Uncharacterized protein n=1 Tax=Petrolisthes manimaculis TaxID=1843537 RepID=A0AAE1PC14_9EUCA|nr:hypothetical protein Pmani_022972 [Petrolisthes manimaculis]
MQSWNKKEGWREEEGEGMDERQRKLEQGVWVRRSGKGEGVKRSDLKREGKGESNGEVTRRREAIKAYLQRLCSNSGYQNGWPERGGFER